MLWRKLGRDRKRTLEKKRFKDDSIMAQSKKNQKYKEKVT